MCPGHDPPVDSHTWNGNLSDDLRRLRTADPAVCGSADSRSAESADLRTTRPERSGTEAHVKEPERADAANSSPETASGRRVRARAPGRLLSSTRS